MHHQSIASITVNKVFSFRNESWLEMPVTNIPSRHHNPNPPTRSSYITSIHATQSSSFDCGGCIKHATRHFEMHSVRFVILSQWLIVMTMGEREQNALQSTVSARFRLLKTRRHTIRMEWKAVKKGDGKNKFIVLNKLTTQSNCAGCNRRWHYYMLNVRRHVILLLFRLHIHHSSATEQTHTHRHNVHVFCEFLCVMWMYALSQHATLRYVRRAPSATYK